MLLTLKKEIEETREVELPMYVKFGGFHKIISDKEYVDVHTGDEVGDIGVRIVKDCPEVVQLFIDKGEQITEAAFNNAQQIALSKLTRELFLSASTPATEEDIKEKLYDDQGSVSIRKYN